MSLVFIKLGGSIITDKTKPHTLNPEGLKMLVDEIQSTQGHDVKMIIGHGGGSFGHAEAKKYETQKGLTNQASHVGASAVHDSMIYLNREVAHALLEKNIPAYHMSPSSFCVQKENGTLEVCSTAIQLAVQKGFVPLIHGDVVFDEKQGVKILSTESVFDALITDFSSNKTFDVSKIIMVTDVDGVYRDDKNKEIFVDIHKENFENIKSALHDTSERDVTGGMLHKIERALQLAERGIKTYIVNGKESGRLRDVLLDKDTTATVIH